MAMPPTKGCITTCLLNCTKHHHSAIHLVSYFVTMTSLNRGAFCFHFVVLRVQDLPKALPHQPIVSTFFHKTENTYFLGHVEALSINGNAKRGKKGRKGRAPQGRQYFRHRPSRHLREGNSDKDILNRTRKTTTM